MLERRTSRSDNKESLKEESVSSTNTLGILGRLRKRISGEKEDPGEMLDTIKTSLYGNQNDMLLQKVDKALDNIGSAIINKSSANYADYVRTLISKTLDNKNILDQIPEMMTTDVEMTDRLNRYINAQEIVDNIPYCARAISVLTNAIISPDDITKKTLEVLEEEDVDMDTENPIVQEIRDIIHNLKLDDYMDEMVYQVLLKGDHFIEICDYESPDVPITSSFLNEKNQFVKNDYVTKKDYEELKEFLNPTTITYFKPIVDEVGKHIEDEKQEFKVKIEISENKSDSINLTEDLISMRDEDLERKIENVKLIVHNPENIVKLQSRRFKMCLGYLVMPEFNPPSKQTFGGSTSTTSSFKFGISGALSPDVNLSGIDFLYKSLIKQVKVLLKKDEIKIDKAELYNLLKRLLNEVDVEDQDTRDLLFKIRFVPANRMEHFVLNSRRFFPYGEGLLFKSTNKAKQLIALETAATVKRISDSKDLRIFVFETNATRDIRNSIEDVKNSMKKRKFSLDSLGNISTIPSSITMYEDIYIPQTKGKRFLEFDTFPPTKEPKDVVEDLKYYRDNIVSNLEVPPAYLNLEENLCLTLKTPITYVDGSTVSLQTIIDNFESGNKDMYVHSYDHSTGKIVPGKIIWAGITRRNAELVRVWTDDNKYIDCTPDHPFMLRNGEYKEAKDLQPGTSLMPFYTKNTNSKSSNGLSYMMVYHPGINKWQLRYHAFADSLNYQYGKGFVIHHLDGDPRNDNPVNLKSITFREHAEYHRDWGKHKLQSGGVLYFEQECRICGTKFSCRVSVDQVTCSPECKSLYHQQTGLKSWDARKDKLRRDYPIISRTCDHCGTEFEMVQTTKYLQDLQNKPYLWYSCGNEKCSKVVKAANISMSKMKGVLSYPIYFVNCEICGNLCVQSDVDKSKKFKTVCRNITCINTKLAREHSPKRKNIYITNCAICGKPVERHGYYKTKYPLTCGEPDCFSENRSRMYNNYYEEDNNCMYVDEECFEEREPVLLNHKVTKVEFLEEKMDCGDIEIEKYHNFAVNDSIFVHNSNKAALSFENALFAQTIVTYQHLFSKFLNLFMNKIYKFIKGAKLSEGIVITFPPPKMLQMERDAERMDMVLRIVQACTELGIDRQWAINKYASQPFDKIKKVATKHDIEKKIIPPSQDMDMMGMGGLGGMGGNMPGMDMGVMPGGGGAMNNMGSSTPGMQ